MTPLLAQTIAAIVVLIALIVLLLMSYLLWLQCRGGAESDRQREARRQRLAARWPSRFPPSWNPPRRFADSAARVRPQTPSLAWGPRGNRNKPRL